MRGNEVQRLAGRVDELMAEIEALAAPPVAARVDELVRTLVELHGAGLDRTVDVLSDGEPLVREATLRQLAADELLAALLVLHDLHPDDVVTRVTRALEEVHRSLGSHADGVELVGVADEASGTVVHLRVPGGSGCSSTADTVGRALEEAILDAVPDVASVSVEAAAPEPVLLQIQRWAGA